MRLITTTILAAASVALMLAGCATAPASRQTEYPLVVYADVENALTAAISALAEKRLGSPTVERTENGASVRGELSGLAGVIYNSHGGSGSVTIATAFPRSKRLSISAVTRSRLPQEPVGAMDTFKGYKYNDPKYAIEILQRIKETLPQGDIDRMRAEDDKARIAWEADEERKAAAAAAVRAQQEVARAALLADAARGSRLTCADDTECRKAFSLAQIYVSTMTDMKIQFATDTIIETYNPTEIGKRGAKVIKMPGAGQSAEIVLTVFCRECPETPDGGSLSLMKEFRQFVETRLR